MAQASIGPGMAVFSRYKEVLEADDERMSVREALRSINAELDEYLARQEGDYDSYTRFAVTWFRQHRFDAGKYGEAEVLGNARDVAVQGVVEADILEARAGSVRCCAARSCRRTGTGGPTSARPSGRRRST